MMRPIVLSLMFLAALAVAEPPKAEQIKNAEKTFRDLYGKDYDRILKSRNAQEKLAFAKKLWETAVGTPSDPSIAYVFGEKAYPLAMSDPAGYAMALEMKQARVEAAGKNRPGQLAAVAEVLEKTLKANPPADLRVKTVLQLVDTYRDQAEAAYDVNREGDAAQALLKAKEAAKLMPPADALPLTKELAAMKEGYDALRKHQNDVKNFKEALKKNPQDAAANLGLGTALLRAGAVKEAAAHLQAGGNESLKKLGAAILQPMTDPLTLGDAYRSAAEALPAMKNTFLGLARKAYFAGAEALPAHANAGRARLIARELPAFRPVNDLSPSRAFVIEVLDEAETFEPALSRWPKRDSAVKFQWQDKQFGGSALTLPPGKHAGPLAEPLKIAVSPKAGEYRYLRVAVRQTGGTYCKIELHAGKHAAVGYCFGSHATDRWISLSKSVPASWQVIRRDLMPDRVGTFNTAAELTLDSLLIESDGTVTVDGLWLGRGARDLDRLQLKPLE